MPTLVDTILSRRSIRRYTGEPVGEDQVTLLLKAAFAAPSAGNCQPWHFVVIRDRATLDAIPSFHQNGQMLKGAPLAILVCADPAVALDQGYWLQDCSVAAQNILLAAHAMGLGAVWLGIYPREPRIKGMRDLLGIPETLVPAALICIGHPSESKETVDRWNAARLHFDRW
jgi:nitroreductase